MNRRRGNIFGTVCTEGGLLPSDMLERIASGDKQLTGLEPTDYHLTKFERIGEAVNRSWSHLLGAWKSFQDALNALPETDLAMGLTRDRWLLPLFQELGYGRLPRASAMEMEGKSYPISHFWHLSPIHLLGSRVNLDQRQKGVAGAAQASPHGLVQDFLNRSDGHLWGFVSNGYVLRILRDHHSLTRQAYVEFDLQAMMDGELYSEFLLLWLVCHQSRLETEKPEECWLEKWFQTSRDEGVRALDHLRDGVETAIARLGSGFLRHRHNQTLRDALYDGSLYTQEYYRQLLRLVYRLIFLFVAEERDVLLDPNASQAARNRYARFYATRRLRDLAGKRRGGPHCDLWRGLHLVMSKLDTGCPELGLPGLGSFLWRDEAIAGLAGADISNEDLLGALRALTHISDGKQVYPVNWRNIGSEELGSIYEALLELHPKMDQRSATFELNTAAGNERKTTGSYYTPSSLVDCLLDSALDPVLKEAAEKEDPQSAILDLKVCDPACGSGHFLVAAARRIAHRLATVRSAEDEPSPEAVQTALRDVVGHCLYGVDINPMAVELCKVSLWMEALEPGRPLSFLDAHIQCGNALLGTTPALLKDGIPDDAFKAIEGDDKAICTEFRKRNKQEREGRQQDLFSGGREAAWNRLGDLATELANLDDLSDDSVEDVKKKQAQYEELVHSTPYAFSKLWADAWCAAFVWEKNQEALDDGRIPVTEDTFRLIEKNPHALNKRVRGEIETISGDYKFFHWHLAYPAVFRVPSKKGQAENEQTGWSGGFDVVLGNPPWERIKLQEKEWFAERMPEIANASSAAQRRKMISVLAQTDPTIYESFLKDRRKAEGESHFARDSGYYPLCGRGDVNTYMLFGELNRVIIDSAGRVGCIVPSGIATDNTTRFYFQDLIDKRALVSFYDFENRKGIFPAVQGNMRFSLLTICSHNIEKFTIGAQLDDPSQLNQTDRIYTLSPLEVMSINPNTINCPTFKYRRDALINKEVYSSIPIIHNERFPAENTWEFIYKTMFHLTNASHLFQSRERLLEEGYSLSLNRFKGGEKNYLPLYEAKLAGQYNHRASTYEGISLEKRFKTHAGTQYIDELELKNPLKVVIPRFWVDEAKVTEQIGEQEWLLSFRDVISAVADSRCLNATILPRSAVGNTLPILLIDSARKAACLISALNSFVLDYLLRQKAVGGHLNYYILKQLPVPKPDIYESIAIWSQKNDLIDWIVPRVVELSYTSLDLAAFAKECGYFSPPFIWEVTRRFRIRCEIDAAYFHLYGINRDDADYILETFPIIRKRDEQEFGEYRTKLTILEIYDAMAEAIKTGKPYQTILDPPPGPPVDSEGNFISMYYWDRNNWPSHIHLPDPEWDESILAAWFGICQKQWLCIDDDQVFPWDGREAFVYALIPYLVQEQPGRKFEFYRDAALMASQLAVDKAFLPDDVLRKQYDDIMDNIEWLKFPDEHRLRIQAIREKLQQKIIQTEATTGETVLQDSVHLPPIPEELKPVLPLLLKAANTLETAQKKAKDEFVRASERFMVA